MHYFIDTFGSKGLSSFNMPLRIKKLYGYPQTVIREITERLAQKAKDENIKTEIIHSFLNNGIKGIAFPKINWCIMNIQPYEEIGLVGSLFNGYNEALGELENAKAYFESALSVHDEWEKYYIDNFDFERLDNKCTELKAEIFEGREKNKEGKVIDRFLGAATAFGAVDYIEDLTENINKRYFIKGRPGTGKSTFMKKIVNEAKMHGFDTECYHCAFDPKSLDMVVIRELSICIFDSTAPHEHFPKDTCDEIIDFYDIGSKRNIDREYKGELSLIAAKYKENINNATDCIARANNIFTLNDKIFEEKCDAKNVLSFAQTLAEEIFG
ncbi:MAG: hypothetical protein E7407_05850 [Ruminococcaceae bacterium]|nr:hypothetical protein [Oscillospiraceae bacterium]